MNFKVFHRRRGFTLLLVIVLIAVTALLAASIASSSINQAQRAARVEKELQERWLMRSAQLTLLEHAGEIFTPASLPLPEGGEKIEPEQSKVRPVILSQWNSGERTVRVILADENAKFNLNSTESVDLVSQTRTLVMRLGGTGVIPIFPRPFARKTPEATAFDSWGQVYNLADPGLQRDDHFRLPDMTSAITCWGDGMVNIRTADDRVVDTLFREVAETTPPDEFHRLRKQIPFPHWSELEAALQWSDEEREKLRPLLAEKSSCYSIWIQIGEHDRLRLQRLSLHYRGGNMPERREHFVW